MCYVRHLQLHFRVSVCYLPSQVSYWEVYDGSAIRELEGSLSGAINGMHISQDGKHFVTGVAHYASAACYIVAVLLFNDFSINVIQPKINESTSTKSLRCMSTQYIILLH